MQKILVVDDSEEIFILVKTALGNSCQISWTPDLISTRKILAQENFDLILLDINLPDGDGFSFYAEMNSLTKDLMPPVIFLSAKDGTAEKVLGLALGAEDYITKGCDLLELKARVESKLKKRADQKHQRKVEKLGALNIDHESQSVWTENLDKKLNLDLTRIEFKILILLMSKQNSLTKRDEILDRVWGQGFNVYPRSVDTHVSHLRKKINCADVEIEAVHGQGYKLVVHRKI